MIDAGYLTDILRTLGRPTRPRFFFRSIPLKFVSTPLSAIGSVRDGGRYNPQGGFEILYAADSEDAVLRETRAVVVDPNTGLAVPQRHPPRVHFTVNLDLQFMVDLTDATNCDAIGVHSDDLVSEWRTFLAASKTPPTHVIGDAARAADIEALLVPSARLPGTKNIAIVTDRLRIGSFVEIHRPEGFPAGTIVRIDGTYRAAPVPGTP